MIKEIDGKKYELRELTPNDYIRQELMDCIDEFEKLKFEVFKTEQELAIQEKELSGIEFEVGYNVNVIEKDKYTNKESRESEIKLRLQNNEVYKSSQDLRSKLFESLKLRKSRLDVLEYKRRAYCSLLENDRHN
jgi:hypothetical protein